MIFRLNEEFGSTNECWNKYPNNAFKRIPAPICKIRHLLVIYDHVFKAKYACLRNEN